METGNPSQDERNESFREELSRFPSQILLHVARNDSATKDARKAAVKLLLEGGHREANHPELRELRMELESEREAEQEVKELVESNAAEGGLHE